MLGYIFWGTPGTQFAYLWRGHLDEDDDGSQGGLGELGRVVDGVGVQHHQLQGFGQLEYALNLTLHFS